MKYRVFFLLLGLNILTLVFFHYLEDYFNIILLESDNKKNILKNPILFIFSAVLFAPVIEEFCFRYNLKKSKYSILTLIFSSIFFFFYFENIILKVFSIIYNLFFAYMYIVQKKQNAPIWIIIVSVFLFSFVHIVNYEVGDLLKQPLFSLVFQFMPFMVAGLILTWLRLNFGFKYSILYHMSYNAIIIIIILITKNYLS